MTMQYDVKSTYLTADGDVFAGPARVKGILVTPATTTGGLIIKDGGTSGTVVFQTSWAESTNPVPFNITFPGEGIRCYTTVYADVTTVTSVTVFYG